MGNLAGFLMKTPPPDVAAIIKRVEGQLMSVRAKFKCHKSEGGRVELSPVYTGSEENKRFFEATPGGSITLEIVNEAAAKQFEVGREYYVDFTPA